MMKEIKLVFGVGINDMRGVPGWRKKDCPFYGTWYSMVQRCHSRNFQKKHPTYKGVTICEEWLTFSQFIAWAKTQDYKDKCLDKDILIPGNKHYSPDACMFVDPLINNQKLIDPRKYLDDHPYPQGVYLDQRNPMSLRYVAKITRYGKQEHIATFSTAEAASSAYCKKKSEYLRELAEKQEPALLRWAVIYENAI
jgi:hypothetical protein